MEVQILAQRLEHILWRSKGGPPGLRKLLLLVILPQIIVCYLQRCHVYTMDNVVR